ncbi:MAG TPA: lactonase family protein [Opitutaceae bacterium]|nr:lactonase family protein [Opitutaceae bacterium]
MAAPPLRFYLGTYTKTGSKGIYTVTLDPATGALSAPEVAAEAGNPTYLAISPDRAFLYAVADREAMAAAYAVDPASGRLQALPAAASPPTPATCYVAVDRTRRVLVAAHYHKALVAALAIRADGTLGPPQIIAHSGRGLDPKRQESAHVHSAVISPDNRFVLVCDLGLDRIYSYRLDVDRAQLAPIDPPYCSAAPGSGPRHLVFSPDARRAYVTNELANTVSVYDYDAARGTLAHRQSLSTLPAGFAGQNTAAEIALHPNGRFLYASNRGHDSIAVFPHDPADGSLGAPEFFPAGGRTPRGFALSGDGRWLVCSHQDSGTVCSFRLDPATGRLARVEGAGSLPTPVGVHFYA